MIMQNKALKCVLQVLKTGNSNMHTFQENILTPYDFFRSCQ